jgi:hypothetical protein
MNHIMKSALCLSTMLLVGAALFISGCGPENLEDQAYLSQLSDNGLTSDAADKDASADKDEDMDDQDKDKMKEKQGENVEGVQQGQAVAVGIPLVETIVLPPAFVPEPPIYETLPPIIIPTSEAIAETQDIIHEREIFRHVPTIEEHVITSSLNQNHVFHDTIINTSSYGLEVIPSPMVMTETVQVLPTTEITLPTVYEPVIGPGPFFGGVPGCGAPWLSGGFYRFGCF